MKLDGKVAIVTGASSGMGKEIAALYAAEGAKVVALARRQERLQALAQEAAAKGQTIIPMQCDISVATDIDKAVAATIEKFGTIDILVNNAGILDDITPVADMTDELWDKIISVNLTAPMKLIRSVISVMLEKSSGNIINVSSVGGLSGGRGGAAYTSSKFGLVGLTKNIGYMYAQKGIRCNAICPGSIETEISTASGNEIDAFGGERLYAGLGTNARIGSAKEIATVALFLASEDSSFINGASIVADGGWTAY